MIAEERLLYQRIAERDKNAFRMLFDTYHAQLFRFAECYVCSPDIAEDIVQEVFIKLWENPNIRISRSLRSYLFFMVKNSCIDHLRSIKLEDKKKLKLVEAQIISESVSVNIDPEVSLKIKRAIDELPTQCKEVYRMSVYSGLKHAEIAEEMDISVNTVKVQVFRAKKILKERLYSLKELLVLFSYIITKNKI
ncbi:RNA polymerase sigma-70 factor [Marinifilum sp. D714]|uniref:RNA polymerase sigma-70 factor n=1 Tax=Marinifilum sp. D714 TaxID=2937523 RepID=UPI0027C77828|nr:RNA polymerase sigma-70 factor [Marinifilum sp. D714]MDQ2178450.1 RNA polymerase sigma-70 factor [Marinifilum sp. D714]